MQIHPSAPSCPPDSSTLELGLGKLPLVRRQQAPLRRVGSLFKIVVGRSGSVIRFETAAYFLSTTPNVTMNPVAT